VKLFKPITVRSETVIDSHMNIINEDDEFKWKYWIGMNLQRAFNANQEAEAFEWALGESGVVSNFLKVIAGKFKTHIKPLLVGEFQRNKDGKWRIHIHGVVRCERQVACRRVKGFWRMRQYGKFMWKVYDQKQKGVAYSMWGHKTIYWGHPACPRNKAMCKGKKGCIHLRRTGNDLLH